MNVGPKIEGFFHQGINRVSSDKILSNFTDRDIEIEVIILM